jgi:hypothetical protein
VTHDAHEAVRYAVADRRRRRGSRMKKLLVLLVLVVIGVAVAKKLRDAAV